jgi:hypothetical protein
LTSPPIDAPGVYQLSMRLHSGEKELRGIAVNIDPAEGDLKKTSQLALIRALDGPFFRLETAESDDAGPSRTSEFRDVLLVLLVTALIFEQAWARRCTRRASA